MATAKKPNSKQKYTDKQKRKAAHIAEGFTEKGLSAKTAAARAWATVNKIDHGGEKPGGGGYGKPKGKRGPKRTASRKK